MSIRVVSIMEAAFVTGPAKNLLEFAVRARPEVDLSVLTYHRPALDGPDPEANPFVKAARERGVVIGTIPEKGRFDKQVVIEINRALEARAPSIVQTHNVKSHFLMRYSGLYRRYRWLAFHHGYTAVDLKMRLYNQLDRWSLRGAAHLVTVCGPFQDQLRGQGIAPERVTVRHNAIQPFAAPDPAEVAAIRRELALPDGVPVLVTISRLSAEKGHLDLLEALAIVKNAGVPAHLVIVGEGTERAAIESARERLNLASNVTLAGHRNQVRPFFALADVFLMPSHSEGSPNALLEAMAAGVPVVASHVGGIPEIATDGETALLVPAHQPAKLAAAIRRTLEDPESARRRAEAAKRVTESFTPEAYRRNLLDIYARVLRVSPGEIA